MTIAAAVTELEAAAQAAAPDAVLLTSFGRRSIGLRSSVLVYRSGWDKLRWANRRTDGSDLIHRITVEFRSPDAAPFVLNDAINTVLDNAIAFTNALDKEYGGLKVWWVEKPSPEFEIEESDDETIVIARMTITLAADYPQE